MKTVPFILMVSALSSNGVGSPPSLTCPAPATVEQTSPTGSMANVTISVEDMLGNQVTVVWSVNGVPVQTNSVPATQPPAASMVTLSAAFPPGTNFVSAQAINAAGDAASCSTTVAVVDTTPPSISCPNIVTTNDPAQCSAVVNFTPTATDASGIASLTSDPMSGSSFSTGTNTVTVTAVDNSGLTNTCTFTVTVLDTEAPVTACRPAPNPSGKIQVPGKNGVTNVSPSGYYQVLAADNCTPRASLNIYVKDTGSSLVAGPFHDGDIVHVRHTGGTARWSVPGTPPIVGEISLNGNGLVVAQDAAGNQTTDANGCLLQP